MEQALSGLKVIDLTHYIAGPYCTKLLADCGADVIKVEHPSRGDGARNLGPFPGDIPHREKSGLFLYLNTNKRGITLDLKTEADRRVFKDLVKEADILVENFSPRVMPALGLSYEALRQINPRLVMTSVSNFGQNGPYRDAKATEIVLQAMSGLMYIAGDKDKEPIKYSLNQAQYMAGVNAAAGTLVAYNSARQTGLGQHVDVSIVESVAVSYFGLTTQYSYTGASHFRGTNDVFRCKDGYLNPYIGERVTWDYYAAFLGALDLIDDRFQTVALRQRYHEEVEAGVTRALAAKGRYEWLYEAQVNEMAFGAMQTMADLYHCPQLATRGYLTTVEHAEAGPLTYQTRSFVMSESPYFIRCPAPRLGEHNEEVRSALRKSAGEPGLVRPPSSSNGRRPRLALEGIRVLDIGLAQAGPWATRLLADFGAEVIRVETPTRPHRCRLMFFPDADPDTELYWEQGSVHHEQHRSKLGVAIEIANPLGREVFKKLVAVSDIVVENSPPRVMKNFRLNYDGLKKINPGIIMLSTTGYGHGGPYGDFRAYGMVIEPMSGLSSMMGYDSPRRGNTPWPDPVAAYHSAFAVMAALQQRHRTGKGQWIDLSQYEGIAGQLGEAFMDYAMNERVRGLMGNRDDVMVPHGCYPCRGVDKWAVIAVYGDEQWRALCAAMENPAWCQEQRFATAEGRRAHQDELDRLIGEWTATQDQYEITERLQRRGIAAGPVLTGKGLLLDPQVFYRAVFPVIEHPPAHPGIGRRPLAGAAWRLSETPGSIRVHAATFGRDNEKVLCGLLGMTEQEVQKLEEAGALSKNPTPWYGLPPAKPLAPQVAIEAGRAAEYDPDYKELLGKAYGNIG